MRRLVTASLFALAALAVSAAIIRPWGAGDSPRESLDAERGRAFVSAVERASPAVVAVGAVEHFVRERRDRLTGRVLVDPRVISRTFPFLGSGVILDGERGLIITNNHVVEGLAQLVVTLPDGRQLEAERVGRDRRYDIALLQVEAENLPSIPIGSTSDLRVGDWALAIGNPFGDLINDPQPTVTAGVISALHRDFRDQRRGQLYLDMIQTDAGINPGNSGGALVDAGGALIGINSFIISPTRSSADIGFAIPVDRVVRIAEELQRPPVYQDFRTRDLQPWMAQYLEIPLERGPIVWEMDLNGPAAQAGLEMGDLITQINGEPVASSRQLEDSLFTMGVGEPIQLTVRRSGEERVVEYELAEGRR